MHIFRLLACSALLGVTLDATARDIAVHKCRGAGGRIAYQETPCGRGSRTVDAWFVTAEAAPRASRRAGTSRPRVGKPRVARRSERGGRPLDACADARARRERIEREAGLSRTYELLSALQREVFEACK